ncbi:MAG TPA: hypothetical protein VGE26_03770 [Sphingobacteriaceae bacterium]
MHFGKIVKGVAHAQGSSAQDLAELLGRSEKHVLELYEQEEWTSGTIKSASMALGHDFGKYLNSSHSFNFLNHENDVKEEFVITVKYSKGKEFLLKTWLQKMVLIARTIGLEIKSSHDK